MTENDHAGRKPAVGAVGSMPARSAEDVTRSYGQIWANLSRTGGLSTTQVAAFEQLLVRHRPLEVYTPEHQGQVTCAHLLGRIEPTLVSWPCPDMVDLAAVLGVTL